MLESACVLCFDTGFSLVVNSCLTLSGKHSSVILQTSTLVEIQGKDSTTRGTEFIPLLEDALVLSF